MTKILHCLNLFFSTTVLPIGCTSPPLKIICSCIFFSNPESLEKRFWKFQWLLGSVMSVCLLLVSLYKPVCSCNSVKCGLQVCLAWNWSINKIYPFPCCSAETGSFPVSYYISDAATIESKSRYKMFSTIANKQFIFWFIKA